MSWAEGKPTRLAMPVVLPALCLLGKVPAKGQRSAHQAQEPHPDHPHGQGCSWNWSLEG